MAGLAADAGGALRTVAILMHHPTRVLGWVYGAYIILVTKT